MGYLGKIAAAATRTPPAHPEGYLEAFANIYRNFANHLASVIDKTTPDSVSLDYPGIEDGIRGMVFIKAVLSRVPKPTPAGRGSRVELGAGRFRL